MLFVGTEHTVVFRIDPTGAPLTAADYDVQVENPDGVIYNDNAGITNYSAPTTTAQGSGDYVFTPDIAGRWVFTLFTGTGAASTMIGQVETWVVDFPRLASITRRISMLFGEGGIPAPAAALLPFDRFSKKHSIVGAEFETNIVDAYVGLTSDLAVFENDMTITKDGMRLYILAPNPTYTATALYQFSFGTAWDISTLTYIAWGDLGTWATTLRLNINVSTDGNYLMATQNNSRYIMRFPFATPYDVTTLSGYDAGRQFDTYRFQGTEWHPDGMKFITYHTAEILYQPGYIVEYTNRTAWVTNGWVRQETQIFGLADALDAAYPPDTRFPYSAVGSDVTEWTITDDGQYLWVMLELSSDAVPNVVILLEFGTPWDVTTLTVIDAPATLGRPYQVLYGAIGNVQIRGFEVSSFDDFQMFFQGRGSDTTYELSQYGVSTTGFFKLAEIIGQDWDDNIISAPVGHRSDLENTFTALWVNAAGTSLIIFGASKVWQYSLSTAWNVESMTYVGEIAITQKYGWQFSADGLTALTFDSTKALVYTLTVAFDITTATTPDSGTTVPFGTGTVFGAAISPDGDKAAVCDGTTIQEITFGTPFDKTTMSLTPAVSIDLTTLKNTPPTSDPWKYTATAGVFQAAAWNEDGSVLAVVIGYSTLDVDRSPDVIYEWDCSSAYDISTAVLRAADIKYLVGTFQRNTEGVAFSTADQKYITLHKESGYANQITTHQIVD